MKTCRYLIMAGGTGGHIFPALAVAKELLLRGGNVAWMGTSVGMEASLVVAERIPFYSITIKGFRGKSWASKLKAPFLLVKAIVESLLIIYRFNPSVVIGFGGFVSAPGGLAARLLGKKLIIHEQNSVAGSSNRLLAKVAHKKLEAFPNSLKGAIHVGNPVRSTIAEINSQSDERVHSRLRVLIMGGSLGAKAINDVVPFAVAAMDEFSRPEIWHQTGADKKPPVSMAYEQLGVSARIDEFVADVASAYRWADIVICRAGALTVSEVAAAGVPAIFIPLPSAIDNHQYHNAKWLLENHAAVMLEQQYLTSETLRKELEMLAGNRKLLHAMHQKLKKLALPDAANQVAICCEELCHAV
jgi:UDP-N-acetylglucosamine--N-acetylmuramyl-(pentapeptide) pyrophosphoryl-undecaprenol N-acetylglucosamine transferase